ncbi:MFS transporter [Undibacterium sp. 14-3-2]|uniref:MFS transporter n=1 Tax=Undibacterium sp. 14-3-2 TaxID=2800129 RepID=UPI001908527A|nr:MFS transporter [Undibacterium sp. 14-3-2]MBK1891727.1 MFS transporter [Undibacterium sp. 14-3-2]
MPSIQTTSAKTQSPQIGTSTDSQSQQPSSSLVLLLASGAGLSVASLYYSQPMLGTLAKDIGVSDVNIGFVPTLTQLGYALGILLLAPLGDRHDRRQIILIKLALLVLALLATAFSHSLDVLLVASLAIGLTATMAQDIVPAAATLAHESRRGKVVGTVMTGLLLGILLSRVVSGFVAERFGWRVMFVIAAVSVFGIGIAMWRGLPRFSPTTNLSYRALLASLLDLLRRHARLRQAALAQGVLSMGFSAFWSTLAVMLHGEPFHMGSAVAGAFGLAGAVGALAAPVAGHLADKRGPEMVTRLGTGLAALSFALMSIGSWCSPDTQLWLLIIGTIGFDLGVQMTLVAHQTIVYGIDTGARSRLNAVLFVGMFIGMAIGASAGSILLAQWGWIAVTGMAALTSLAAFALRLKTTPVSKS